MKSMKRILRNSWLGAITGLALLYHEPSAQAGSVVTLFYSGISTSADPNSVRDNVSTLTNAAIFPNQPTSATQLDDFTGPLLGLQNNKAAADFGDWTRGFIEAPVTGKYIFNLSSDDESEFWLSSDTTAANRQLIASEYTIGPIYPSQTFPLFYGSQIAQRQSAPVSLVQGQKYYFELLHKQGAGNSYFEVGWQRPDGIQEIIPALHLAQFPVDLTQSPAVTNQAPVLNATGLNAGDLPSTISTNEGAIVLLQVDVIAAQPTTIWWTSNGVVIPGANLSYLELPPLSAAANNATIQATVSNAFGVLKSTAVALTVTPDTTPPSIVAVDPLGNPNQVTVTFSKPVSLASAANPANYQLATASGTSIAIQSATLVTTENFISASGNLAILTNQNVVQLSGNFNFIAGSNYVLTVQNVKDRTAAQNLLAPNPSSTNFTYGSPAGITYTFNNGLDYGLQIFGNSYVDGSGGPDGSGYLSLVDAQGSQSGSLRFPGPVNVDQFHLHFKARIAEGSSPPADGWSLSISPDLPLSSWSSGNDEAEQGYNPTVSNPPRFIVAFETYSGHPIGVTVSLNGNVLTNVLAGVNGVPGIYDPDGNGDWVDWDFNLQRNGQFTLAWDGVTVINQLQTGFQGIQNAWVGLDARNGGDDETVWLDNVNLNYQQGDFGPVTISTANQPANTSANENSAVTLGVLPTGASPFSYQWLFNGTALPAQTNRFLNTNAIAAAAGNYSVVVSNSFSAVTSAVAALTVAADHTPPVVTSLQDAAGGLNEVVLLFSKPVNPATATNPATYSFNSITLSNATVSADGKTVTLLTSQQTSGQTNTLKIAGLTDTTAAANVLNTNISFVATLNYQLEVFADNPFRYWRFEETNGTTAASIASGFDAGAANVNATEAVVPGPTLGVPSLVANQPGSRALELSAAAATYLTVPNGSDINANDGPWSQKTIEFWIKPGVLPSANPSGLLSSGPIWYEGGTTRAIVLYLWADPAITNANTTSLVFTSNDNASDGPGSPYGLTTQPSIYVEYSNIVAGHTYHVVGVYDGDASGNFNGQLILYVNGVNVGSTTGIGQIYAHTGGIEIGRADSYLHTGDSGYSASYDGVVDELSLYASVLSPDRIAAHYKAGITPPGQGNGPPLISAASQPASITTNELSKVSFSVAASGSVPFAYQWYFAGAALPGATTPTLSLTATVAAGGNYYVVVTNNLGVVTSAVATLAVIPDHTAPTLVSVQDGAGTLNELVLTFSKPLNPATATNPATYSLPGLTVVGATLGANGETVTLITSQQTAGATNSLTITGLKDTTASGNVLTTTTTFISDLNYELEVSYDSPVRYWRFEETNGTTAVSIASGIDLLGSAVNATYVGTGYTLGAPSILPSQPGSRAVRLSGANGDYLTVPTGSDYNANNGPWAYKTIEFWFSAVSVPTVNTNELNASAGLWYEGGATRAIELYLWQDPANTVTNQSSLIFHAYDNASDGVPSPWGLTSESAIYVQYSNIVVGQTYHVVGVFDGDLSGNFAGNLILYVNSTNVGQATGVGGIYNHTGGANIGRVNALLHTSDNGVTKTFDGVLDEFAYYTNVLSPARIAEHYQAGLAAAPTVVTTTPPVIQSISIQNGSITITWNGSAVLQSAAAATGPFTTVAGAASPYTKAITGSSQQFYRLLQQ